MLVFTIYASFQYFLSKDSVQLFFEALQCSQLFCQPLCCVFTWCVLIKVFFVLIENAYYLVIVHILFISRERGG